MKLILHLCTWFCHQQYFSNWLLFGLCPSCSGPHPVTFWASPQTEVPLLSSREPCSNIQASSQWSLFPLYCSKLISPLFTLYVCYFLCSQFLNSLTSSSLQPPTKELWTAARSRFHLLLGRLRQSLAASILQSRARMQVRHDPGLVWVPKREAKWISWAPGSLLLPEINWECCLLEHNTAEDSYLLYNIILPLNHNSLSKVLWAHN